MLRSGMWRKRASKTVLVVAAVACIATSKRGWHLEATVPPVGRPSATQAVEVVVDATRPPIVTCGGVDSEWLPLDDPNHMGATQAHTYLCPPGRPLGAVQLFGKDGPGGGLCDGEPEPPSDVSIAVRSARVVRVWTKAIDYPVMVPADGVFVNITTSYPYTFAAVRDRDGRTVDLHTTEWTRRVLIYGDAGPAITSRVTLTLFGACRDDACAPPADAAATLVEGQ
jgi:hypothetical protein